MIEVANKLKIFEEMNQLITREVVDSGMSYDSYIQLINKLVSEGRTTGPKQSEGLVNYTKLNAQRMHRVDKTVEIGDELKAVLSNIKKPQVWLVLTEGWCGDAAVNVPVLSKMADASDKITLKLILRDENLPIMDAYLTNGGRAIPKMIALDAETREELFTWGPRPAPAQQMMTDFKADAKGRTKDDVLKEMQVWYAKDKGQTLQKEIAALVE